MYLIRQALITTSHFLSQSVEGFRPYRHLPGSYPQLRWPRLYSVCGSTKLRTSLKMKGGTRYAHTTGCYNRKTTPGRRRAAGANRNSTAFSQLRRNRTKVTSTFRGRSEERRVGKECRCHNERN